MVKQERERKLMEERIILEKKEMKKKQLVPEPEESNPNAITISFRCPDGKKLTRRFQNTSTIEVNLI